MERNVVSRRLVSNRIRLLRPTNHPEAVGLGTAYQAWTERLHNANQCHANLRSAQRCQGFLRDTIITNYLIETTACPRSMSRTSKLFSQSCEQRKNPKSCDCASEPECPQVRRRRFLPTFSGPPLLGTRQYRYVCIKTTEAPPLFVQMQSETASLAS